ncbi:hypothetical protein FACS1894208_11720 [Clostridia bacterium]|nr:hypothetical protein FACS1894208_11720 [Clostridia bacterium]
MDGKTVYAIKFAGDLDYTNIACRCELRNEDDFKGLCYLTPPDRPHMIEGAIIEETPDGFKFKSTSYAPGEWKFKALTIDNFRKEYHKLVIGGAQIAGSVSTTEELYDYFNRL